MTDKIDENKTLYITPDFSMISVSIEQDNMFDNLQSLLSLVHVFLKSNKKSDFEIAYKQLNECLSNVQKLTLAGECHEQIILDVVHDVMLFPCYVLEKCNKDNELNLNTNF